MKVIQIAFFLLTFFAFGSSSLASTLSDDQFCSLLEDLQKQVMADSGKMLDKYTRNDGMSVLCNTRIVEFKKFLLISSNNLREGWQDRKQAQWNEIYCKNNIWSGAINRGWTVAYSMITSDGKRFWHKAQCEE